MSETSESTAKAKAFAARAAARFQRGQVDAAPIARFDPIWIAVALAILKVLIEYLGTRLDPNFPRRVARLKSPRWWRPRALLLRARLASAARHQIVLLRDRRTRSIGPSRVVDDDSIVEPTVDAVLDEAAASTPELLRDLARELQS